MVSSADSGSSVPLPVVNQRVLLAIPTGAFEGSYVTKILELREGGYKVYAPSFRGTILPIPPGENLQVHYSRDSSHFEYECRILERYPGPIPTILISGPGKDVRKVQRRNFLRLGANLPLEMEPVSPLPGTPPPGPPSKGVTVNISAGGLLLESPELYPEGALLDLALELPDSQPAAYLRAEVIRDAGRASPGARATWFLALEFLAVPEEVRHRITRYMHLVQRTVQDTRADAEDEES